MHIRLSIAQNVSPHDGAIERIQQGRGVVKYDICVGRIFKGK